MFSKTFGCLLGQNDETAAAAVDTSPIFHQSSASKAPGHSPLSLGTGHSWPHIFHRSPFKVPCFFFRLFLALCLSGFCGWQPDIGVSRPEAYRLLGFSKRIPFGLLENANSQSQSFIWVFPKIVVPQNGWCIMETLLKWMIWGTHYFRKHPYNHHVNIHLFDVLFDVLIHVMDIWSEIYHLGYCHLQLLSADSQVLKLFNGRCTTCIWQTTWSITSALWRTLCSCKKMAQTSINDTSLNVCEETLLLKKLHDDVGWFNTIIEVSSIVLLSFDKFSLTFWDVLIEQKLLANLWPFQNKAAAVVQGTRRNQEDVWQIWWA